jgi:16S rRNA (cytidine1402-2'-O)-methyltransferase
MPESPGTLYVVATPIGNLQDMSPRACRVLELATIIAAEDTRRTGQLLSSFGCKTPLMAVHEHNEGLRVPQLLGRLRAGDTVALVSDAGTPLISDPGFQLVRACLADGLRVVPVPGPSAVMAALQVAGLPTDRFRFEGFLPRKAGQRRERLAELIAETHTIVLFEAVHRIEATLADLVAVFGPGREACMARELTKLHESVVTGSLGELASALARGEVPKRGEFVLVVAGAPRGSGSDLAEARRVYELLSAELKPDRALKLTAQITGCKRNELYAELRTSS